MPRTTRHDRIDDLALRVLFARDVTKLGGRQEVTPERTKQLRKEILRLVKVVESIDDFGDIAPVVKAVRGWAGSFETFLTHVRQELESRLRDAKYPREGESPPDESWVKYQLDHMTPVWSLRFEVNSVPEEPEIRHFEGPEAVKARMWEYFRKEYPPATAEYEMDEFFRRSPPRTSEDVRNDLLGPWREKARKWAGRVRARARKAWKYLDDLSEWSLRYVGGGRPVVVTTPDEETVVLEGFQTVFRGFAESPYQDKLEAVREGLRRYRTAAARRAPVLLQKRIPIVIEWTFEPGTSGDAAAYYDRRGLVHLTPWVIDRDIDRFVKTMAHEMGHHLIATYLSGETVKAWSDFVRGNYKTLDLREALETMRSVGARSHLDKTLIAADPILYLQLDTLMHDSSYRHTDLLGVENIQKYLDDGGDPLVRVPVTPITGYAAKNSDEAFCEALGMWVAYGPRAVLEPVAKMLRAVLPEVRVASVRGASVIGRAKQGT